MKENTWYKKTHRQDLTCYIYFTDIEGIFSTGHWIYYDGLKMLGSSQTRMMNNPDATYEKVPLIERILMNLEDL